MKHFKLSAFSVVFICLPLVWVSCETAQKNINSESDQRKGTLNLNFHDNILELNPLKASNPGEIFIAELVFDKIYDLDTARSLIEEYRYDTLEGVHYFELKTNKQFHDGSEMNTEVVRGFFKYLISNQFENPSVQSLFSSMDGFGLINWYRVNRNVIDSLPNGFQTINKTRFSIKLRSGHENIQSWLQDPVFTLFKREGDSYIGSGPYQLIELKEDISAELVQRSVEKYAIENIHISFLKNTDLVISEFLRGSLDLITFNPYSTAQTEQTDLVKKLLKKKYPEYQICPTDQSIVRYLEIYNLNDTSRLKTILKAINHHDNQLIHIATESALLTFDVNSLINNNPLDTSIFSIQWYSEIRYDTLNYFSDQYNIKFSKSNSKNVNQSEQHIVIREMKIDFVNHNDLKSSTYKLGQRLQNEENSIFLILNSFPEFVIYNNNLKGITSNTSLSRMVRNAYYQKVKTY